MLKKRESVEMRVGSTGVSLEGLTNRDWRSEPSVEVLANEAQETDNEAYRILRVITASKSTHYR